MSAQNGFRAWATAVTLGVAFGVAYGFFVVIVARANNAFLALLGWSR